mgnify:FL=1
MACDGGSSRVRNALFPGVPKYQVPVRMMGVRIDCDPEEIDPIRKLDAFFLQGAASQNDSFVYCSSTLPISCFTFRFSPNSLVTSHEYLLT